MTTPASSPLTVLAATFRETQADARVALVERLMAETSALDERVVVDTCHRVELVGVGPLPRGVAPQRFEGRDAAARVLTVAAGFDSAVLAEEQILGQVREAYETARARGETGPVTNELLRRAIRFGKRVRTEARPGSDRSLADRGAAWLIERLAPGASILVVGTGEMGRLLAGRLAGAGLRVDVASRTHERAAVVLDRLPRDRRGRTVLLSDAFADPGAWDALAIAVRSAASRLERAPRRVPIVVDLSTPPAVGPEARAALGARLLDLDRLGAAPASAPFPSHVERRLRAELEAEVDRFMAWLRARGNGDGVALLRQHAEEIRRRHLDRLQRRARLAPEQARAVEAATAAMLGELLHGPTVELRSGTDAARRVRQVFGIDR